MMQILVSKNNCMIFTEDLKNIVHLAEANDRDLSLVLEMAKRFNQQHQGVRFGAFVFGPVVMRMYYHLNQPDAALAALQTKELEGFFDQMISHQLLMDLLYNNERYQDALDVFELLQEKRIAGIRYPKPCLTIAVATCLKINTQESLTRMLKLLESTQEYGFNINRNIILYAAALALKQNHPHFALDFLLKSFSPNHFAIRTMKVMALCDLDRVEDIFPILRSIMQIDLPATSGSDKGFHILSEAVVAAENAVRKTLKKNLIAEFESISRSLQENSLISDKVRFFIYSCGGSVHVY
ncbi:pentatricopeptide repeat-containing protein 2, mitochondrial-like isoform X2 [Panulirus ornatus]